ncbi:MAG: hypothetical protein R3C18_25710 [Planctomycetaceae bacterium]
MTPSSFIKRTTVLFQSSSVSRRTIDFMAALAFEQGGIDADLRSRNQFLLRSHLQNKGKDLLHTTPTGETVANACERTVVGTQSVEGGFPESRSDSGLQRPHDAALRADAFKVPHKQHADVDSGWNPGRPAAA